VLVLVQAQVTPGKGAPQQGGLSGREHCARGELGHIRGAGETCFEELCQEDSACPCQVEVEAQVVVPLGYPRPERLDVVFYTPSKPCRLQLQP
jgi:hypothetical protein